MYILKETTAKDEKITSQQVIFKGTFEEAQARMQEKATADKEATDGLYCEVKEGEDYYSRVTNESHEWYRLDIQWEV